jgi:hypothetical protein
MRCICIDIHTGWNQFHLYLHKWDSRKKNIYIVGSRWQTAREIETLRWSKLRTCGVSWCVEIIHQPEIIFYMFRDFSLILFACKFNDFEAFKVHFWELRPLLCWLWKQIIEKSFKKLPKNSNSSFNECVEEGRWWVF